MSGNLIRTKNSHKYFTYNFVELETEQFLINDNNLPTQLKANSKDTQALLELGKFSGP